jgi:hypothetical protein
MADENVQPTTAEAEPAKGKDHLKKVSKGVTVEATDTCFVMMPFAAPLGGYYTSIYEPAIKKAGLTPVRADTDIFGTGKLIDQIWAGLNRAKVLVAKLTGRNPNVLYKLGLAHALHKPVVLGPPSGARLLPATTAPIKCGQILRFVLYCTDKRSSVSSIGRTRRRALRLACLGLPGAACTGSKKGTASLNGS